jgi:hypothetical protein
MPFHTHGCGDLFGRLQFEIMALAIGKTEAVAARIPVFRPWPAPWSNPARRWTVEPRLFLFGVMVVIPHYYGY